LKRDPYHIVVARYKEDVSWLDGYRYVKIYNKDCGDNLLPNIGRESHTYLHYIIENYYNLPEIVFFTQGKIYDHTNKDVSCFLNISGDHSTELLIDKDVMKDLDSNGHTLDREGADRGTLGFYEWFKKNITDEETIYLDNMKWFVHAVFSVRRHKIESRPLNFYKSLILNIQSTKNPEEGYFMERSWYYVFNLHKQT
jgi:hypothetical protein